MVVCNQNAHAGHGLLEERGHVTVPEMSERARITCKLCLVSLGAKSFCNPMNLCGPAQDHIRTEGAHLRFGQASTIVCAQDDAQMRRDLSDLTDKVSA